MDETRVENLNLGHATAYGYAKAKGYEGTEEEFAQLCANLGIDIEQLENMTVIINMLDPDDDPSGTYSDGVLTLNLPRGVKGDTGESAYEYAVAGGYTGTEEEFQQLCADLGIEVDHLKNMTVVVNMVAPSVQPSATYVDGTLTINIQSATAEQVSTATDAWLAQNITNPSNPPLDRSLTLANAAAPADLTGELKSALNEVLLPITNYTIGNYTFSTSDGSQSPSDTRLCTSLIYLKKGSNIKFTPNALQYIYGYFNYDKTSFIASDSWASTNVDFTMPYDGFFEIQFRKPNNASITVDEFTDTLVISGSFAETVKELDGDYINPDNYSGTDTQKLQSAMDALASTGGAILITRAYSLESNLVCTHNSNNNRLLRFCGIGNASIEFNRYSIVGGNSDHTGTHGGIVLDGLLLLSNGNTPSIMFSGDSLIRIYIRNCVISGFASIVRANSTYLQTVFIDSCLIRSVGSIIINDTGTRSYDLHISNNVIESCRNVLVSYDSNGIFVTNNLIEGLAGTPFGIRNTAHKVYIDGNYFENNGSSSSLVENGATLLALASTVDKEISVTVSNNLIHQSLSGGINKLIVLPAKQIVGQVVIANNFCLSGGMLVSALTSIKHQNVLYYCNTTHEKEYDEGQYDCGDYVTVITASMINELFST